jgi:hypothetical protein
VFCLHVEIMIGRSMLHILAHDLKHCGEHPLQELQGV